MADQDPIIIRGGASVTIEYPDSYTPETAGTKPELSATGRKMKNANANLAYLEVKSTGEKINLEPDDVITIHTR